METGTWYPVPGSHELDQRPVAEMRFSERIVESQQPANVDDADNDELVPSDGGLVAWRRLRRSHQEELRSSCEQARPAS